MSSAVKIHREERRSRVLTPSTFGCLAGRVTINVTRGCSHGCSYCYASGYANAPPPGHLVLYENLPDLIGRELDSPRRRKEPPDYVVMNTASDCFQPEREILDVSYRVMETLLERGIGVSFLTKGEVPDRFIRLFSGHRDMVRARIGLVSLDHGYWKTFEPAAAPPGVRLDNVSRLMEAGLQVSARVDPVIPFVTDGEEEILSLFEALSVRGIEKVGVSYLHLRPAVMSSFKGGLDPVRFEMISSLFRGRDWERVGAATTTKLVPVPIRERGYDRMRRAAGACGMEIAVCACKNPDISSRETCDAAWPRTESLASGRSFGQLPLF